MYRTKEFQNKRMWVEIRTQVDSRADVHTSQTQKPKALAFPGRSALSVGYTGHGSWDIWQGWDPHLLINPLLQAKGHFAKASFLCSCAKQEMKKKSSQPVAQPMTFSGEKVTNKVKTLCLILNFGSQVEVSGPNRKEDYLACYYPKEAFKRLSKSQDK